MSESRTKNLECLRLYTLSEIEDVIGVTHRSLLTYVKDGRLKAKKIGGKWRVTEAELKRFLEE